VVNDETDGDTRDDASNEHAAKREEVPEPRTIRRVPRRGLIGRLNVMICHRSAGDVGRHWGGRPRVGAKSIRVQEPEISVSFRSARKVSRACVAHDTRARHENRCPDWAIDTKRAQADTGRRRAHYWAGHHRGTRNRKPKVSRARIATATTNQRPLIRLSATVPKATNAATAYMPSTALRWVCPISNSR
jgi:hypothetical protein